MFTVNNSYDCMVDMLFQEFFETVKKFVAPFCCWYMLFGNTVLLSGLKGVELDHTYMNQKRKFFCKSEADVFNSRPVNIDEF